MLGFRLEALPGLSTTDLHEETPQLHAYMASVQAEGHAWTDQLTVTTTEGRLIPVEAAAATSIFEGRRVVINLIRPLSEGGEADPALRLRLMGRSA